MKIKLLVLTLLLVCNLSYTQSPKINFLNYEHDFGEIEEDGGSVSHTFEFANEGTSPLVILSVKPSCGCTTPNWSKDPIKPGGKGFIIAQYDPKGRPGVFRKSRNHPSPGWSRSRAGSRSLPYWKAVLQSRLSFLQSPGPGPMPLPPAILRRPKLPER